MKIIKKLFSFVCCLFLAVSCFAPFASAAMPMKDGEHCYFELKARRGIHLTTYRHVVGGRGGITYGAVGDPVHHSKWFVALVRGNAYQLRTDLAGCDKNGNRDALDQCLENSIVYLHPAHDGTNQLWKFIPAPAHPFYRIQNVGRGEYLTFNPEDCRVYGYTWCATDNQIWIKH